MKKLFRLKTDTRTGIILCGGKSTRFGSDKGMSLFKGKELVLNAVEILKPLCNEIIFSTGNKNYTKYGYRCVADKITSAGPLSGIYSALTEAKYDKCLVLACDIPLIPTGLFSCLLAKMNKFQAIVPVHNGFIEPLVAVYNKSASELMKKMLLNNQYKMIEVLKNMNTMYYEITESDFYKATIFLNINSTSDLENYYRTI